MKKFIVCLPLLLILCSCSHISLSENSQSIGSTDKTNDYLQIDLPQLNKKHQRMYYVEWGKLSESSYDDVAYIFTDEPQGNNDQKSVYLLADVNGKHLLHTIGVFETQGIQNGRVALKDFDGDGIDEILIHFEIAGNGATLTQIYKIVQQQIVLVSDLCEFETGYTGKFLDGRKLLISNRFTGYETTLHISGMFADDFFDERGKAVTQETIVVSAFTNCEVVNIGNDETYALRCTQTVSLLGYIGKVKTLLQYDRSEKSFKVIEASFIPGSK